MSGRETECFSFLTRLPKGLHLTRRVLFYSKHHYQTILVQLQQAPSPSPSGLAIQQAPSPNTSISVLQPSLSPTSFLQHTASSNSSTSVLQQALSPNPSNSALPHAPSPTPPGSILHQVAPPISSAGGGDDLWTKAYYKLPDELQQQLGMNQPGAVDKLQTLQSVLQMAVQAREANTANRLKLKFGNREIDVQEAADRLVGWVTEFKEVGDIAVQYDPVHAALPWAGVRFILLVRSIIHCLYFIGDLY